ncbi:MAG: ATP-binding protein [Desulfobacteraceae bacterium]|nr:ATP-binding protein [Desulfobacteraceae bacterium]
MLLYCLKYFSFLNFHIKYFNKGYVNAFLPFSQPGGTLLFHRISKLYEKASLIITTHLNFEKGSKAFGDEKMNVF